MPLGSTSHRLAYGRAMPTHEADGATTTPGRAEDVDELAHELHRALLAASDGERQFMA